MFAACVKGQEVGGVVIQEKKAINKKKIQNNRSQIPGADERWISNVIVLSATAWLLPPRLLPHFISQKRKTRRCTRAWAQI